MGWNNPPVPWREFEQRLSWRSGPRPVTRLPTGKSRRSGPDGRDRDGLDRNGLDRDGLDRDGPDGDGLNQPGPGPYASGPATWPAPTIAIFAVPAAELVI